MTDILPMNFLGLDARHVDYSSARYAIWPVGYDATASYRAGTREGPAAIIAASRQLELFDADLGREIHLPGVATLDHLDPDVSSPEATLDGIYREAKKILKPGSRDRSGRKFLITLGGEHTISLPLIRAHADHRNELSVLQIDAHLDMRDRYQGSKFSHACVMRRIHELGVATVSVGIRSVAVEEHRYLRRRKYPVFTAEQMRENANSVIADAMSNLTNHVYLTIDLDGFDPAYAPGVGTPEPGGLNWFQVNDLLKELTRTREIIGADIVETLPLPGQVVTEFLAAKLVARIIALTQISEQKVGRKQR